MITTVRTLEKAKDLRNCIFKDAELSSTPDVSHGLCQQQPVDRLRILSDIDLSTIEGIENLATRLKSELGRTSLDHVVSCFGGPVQKGPISKLRKEAIHQAVDRSMPHFFMLQKIWPMLADSSHSSFIFIDGMLGERCHMPNLACLSVSNSFLYGLILAFQAENSDMPQRINEIRIGAMICKNGDSRLHPIMGNEPSKSLGEVFPSCLIGQEVVKIATDSSINRQTIRITPEYLQRLIADK